jgi:hypothetical protein
MILYRLACGKGHEFETWFKDGAAYDRLAKGRRVVCPECGTRKVDKAPMSPRVAKRRNEQTALPAPAAQDGSSGQTPPVLGEVAVSTDKAKAAEMVRLLRELRKVVETNCDYVGENFAEEARRIHYGEADPRGIYGETTDDEARELDDEGISVRRIPWVPRTDS